VTYGYSADIESIMVSSCATSGCHDAITKDAGIDLSTYNLVKLEAGNKAFLQSVKHKGGFAKMPEGKSKLPAAQITAIECWIQQGMAN